MAKLIKIFCVSAFVGFVAYALGFKVGIESHTFEMVALEMKTTCEWKTKKPCEVIIIVVPEGEPDV